MYRESLLQAPSKAVGATTDQVKLTGSAEVSDFRENYDVYLSDTPHAPASEAVRFHGYMNPVAATCQTRGQR